MMSRRRQTADEALGNLTTTRAIDVPESVDLSADRSSIYVIVTILYVARTTYDVH